MGTAKMAQAEDADLSVARSLRPAAQAFDAIAAGFDLRFGSWLSVAAQRRAVRSALLREFPADGSLLEIGGGTGEDAAFLAARGFQVHLTDPSPTMVSIANRKLLPLGSRAEIAAAEEMDAFAGRHLSTGGMQFDGAYSNFAPLNCVHDLLPVASGLARLLKPGACAMLVLFGTFCPSEMLTEALRGRPHLALRRFKKAATLAKISQREFTIVYHRRAQIVRAFAPWFKLERRLGIGVAVPPSAAEPWISHHRGLLSAMERIDLIVSSSLAAFSDHVLYQFRRILS